LEEIETQVDRKGLESALSKSKAEFATSLRLRHRPAQVSSKDGWNNPSAIISYSGSLVR